MKHVLWFWAGLLALVAPGLRAHVIGDATHDAHAREPAPVRVALPRPEGAERPRIGDGGALSPMTEMFARFASAVRVRQVGDVLLVESNGMPAHNMMVGITAWQQQVPIPQRYTGDNAWRIPLHPVVAKSPLSAKSHFFKGAIALAANGIPIFNPIKTNGRTDTFLAGELDQWGGHCGRADDYHYHIAPLHLQAVLGERLPLAYALDGYAIYGLTEPDGSVPGKLDEFNGHETPGLGYHYHASKTYPYINGGFRGEVVERDGQVDPQPRTNGVREAMPPLPGATITGFSATTDKSYSLKYEVRRETRFVNYTLNDNGSVTFDFVDGQGAVKSETDSGRQRGGGGGGGAGGAGDRPRGGGQNGQGKAGARTGERRDGGRNDEGKASEPTTPPLMITPRHTGNLVLTSPVVADGDALPDEFTGNGAGATLPLAWSGAPEGTRSFALVMDHIDRDGLLKTYWVLHGIPPTVTSLPKNAAGIGQLGATWKRDQGYVPPHSSGGTKQTYTLHLYALSAAPQLDAGSGAVTRDALLARIKDSILDSADLRVTYQRPNSEATGDGGEKKAKRPRDQTAKQKSPR